MLRGLLLMLVSQASYAAYPDFLLPFLGHDKTWPTQQSIKQSPYWFECNESDARLSWCSDEFDYYSVTMWGEVTGSNNDSVSDLTLHSAYTRHSWTQLQLNLRKDGFEIVQVEIGDKQFSVPDALDSGSPEQANRDLVVFLNQSAWVFPQVMYWQHGHVRAKLESDGQNVYLHFSH